MGDDLHSYWKPEDKPVGEVVRREEELEELLEAARSILTIEDFETCARHIFDSCCRVTGATFGYVALLSESGEENEVLFLESGGRPCTVDPDLPMPIRGLRAEAYHSGEAVYDNDFNLLNNAIYACAEGGTIIVSTGADAENYWFEIGDDGRGISPEHLERIFEPFFTTKPEIKGTGLGLSVSYGIVKRHGGTIEVRSEPNTATAFTVTLPIRGPGHEG